MPASPFVLLAARTLLALAIAFSALLPPARGNAQTTGSAPGPVAGSAMPSPTPSPAPTVGAPARATPAATPVAPASLAPTQPTATPATASPIVSVSPAGTAEATASSAASPTPTVAGVNQGQPGAAASGTPTPTAATSNPAATATPTLVASPTPLGASSPTASPRWAGLPELPLRDQAADAGQEYLYGATTQGGTRVQLFEKGRRTASVRLEHPGSGTALAFELELPEAERSVSGATALARGAGLVACNYSDSRAERGLLRVSDQPVGASASEAPQPVGARPSR